MIRGYAGPVLVDMAESADDLLIIGTGRRTLLGRGLRKSVGRYCLAHARCPVLAVPPSALMDEMSRGLPDRLTAGVTGRAVVATTRLWPGRCDNDPVRRSLRGRG